MTEREFEILVRTVAKGIGYKVSNIVYDRGMSALLISGNADIILRFGGRQNAGRINVSGLYPTLLTGRYTDVGIENVSITMSGEKTAELMIEEIKRRFMPEYETNLKLALEYKGECDDFRKGVIDSLTRLAFALNTNYILSQTDAGYVCGRYGALKIESRGPDNVRMIIDVSTDKALRVIETLKGLQ